MGLWPGDGMDNTVRFDNSLLSTTYCTTRALLRHKFGLTTERDDQRTMAGRAAHTALAVYFRGAPADVAMDTFAVEYEEVAPQDGGDRLSFANTSAILRQWLVTHPVAELPFEVLPELIEVPFELPLVNECVCGHPQEFHANGADNCLDEDVDIGSRTLSSCPCEKHQTVYVFTGRVDAIVRDRHTGWLHVLDHKTTGRLDTSQYRDDSQMTGYVWAAGQAGHKVQGAYINAISFALLPGMKGNGHYKCRLPQHKGMTYDECRMEHVQSELALKTRTPDQLTAWRVTALALARRFREMSNKYLVLEDVADAPTEGRFYYNGCRYCPFQEFCQGGKVMEFAEAMLVYKPWSPLE